MEFKIFDKPGHENTIDTLKIAKKNANDLGIKDIIIASTKGDTISHALKIFSPKEYRLICVTHNYSFQEGVIQEFPDELRKDMEKQGVFFVTGTLAFSGVSSALLRKFQVFDPIALFSRLFRIIIADGVKVSIEIVLMAVDAGMITSGQDVIAVGGTGYGADSCCLIKAAGSRQFENLRVKAILAKPM